jgi:hypothetical protein
MPFTFAHPAIVLPFGRLSKRWISLTGLVVGSMTPDFEYFIRMRVSSVYSHTLPGLFWFDIPIGLLIVFFYQTLVKDKLIDHLPVWLNSRFSVFKGKQNYSLIYFLVLCVSILIGATSHILWDAFTHPRGYFVGIIPALSGTIKLMHHQVYIYKILQHSSTIIGLIIILLTIHKLPGNCQSEADHTSYYWLKLIIVMIIILVLRLLSGLSLHAYGDWIVTSISAGLIGLLLISVTIPTPKGKYSIIIQTLPPPQPFP